ncbi:MAG: right-handed parallel beta-helix repeat-containing protein [Euryarchaeota archaeon]|nr:right-handed parallel beta-helix repeat-containing protein [Euryarchaeota archaeon]
MGSITGKCAAITVGILVMLTAFFMVGQHADEGAKASQPSLPTNYISHAPIRINSNAEFAAKAASEGWNGSGIAGNPYNIENYDINGNGYTGCIYIGNSTSFFTIRNCYLHSASGSINEPFFTYSGLALYNSQNGSISNNTVKYNIEGIYTNQASHNAFTNNTVVQNIDGGVYIKSSSNNTVIGNNCSNNFGGLYFVSGSNYNIASNNIANSTSYYGIYLSSSSNNSVSNCTSASNAIEGISLLNSNGNAIMNNSVSSNPDCGVYLSSSNGNFVSNNFLSLNGAGIYVQGSSGNVIINNTVSSNNPFGVHVVSSSDNSLYNNNIIDNTGQGDDNGNGNLWNASYPRGGNYWSNYAGVDVMSGPNQDIPGADGIGDTPYFIDADSRDNYPLMKLFIDGRVQRPPIRINSNAEFTPQNGVSAGDGTQGNPYIIENWDINGTGNGSCVYVGNTTSYFMVRNCHLHHAAGISGDYYWNSGLVLYSASNGYVSSNNASSNDWEGIYIRTSSYNTVKANAVINNGDGIFIDLAANYNVVANNTFSANSFFGIGIVFSTGNTVTDNMVSNNNEGFNLSLSNNNVLVNNTISFNYLYGIHLLASNVNSIYHNNFINNTYQAYDNQNDNMWNSSYPSGGNYWSNYTGADVMSGPNQDIPGSDGFGDTPFIIDADSQDQYPLISPYNGSPITPQPPSFMIPVVAGWNLISIPLIPYSPQLPAVLTDRDGDTLWDRVQWYDAFNPSNLWRQYYTGWSPSLSDLNTVNQTMGAWVYVTAVGDGFIKVNGTVANTTSIPLRAGWNLVGYPTLNSTVKVSDALWGTSADIVEVFDPAAPYRTRTVAPSYIMRPGEGYWIHANSDSIWTVNW